MPTSVFYHEFERHAHGEGINAHSTTLLPRLRPRAGAEVPGRGHRRARGPGPHGPRLAGRLLGVHVLLLRRRATRRPPHGRAPAVAIGHKTSNPDSVVICYQGDGDLASIGLAEIVSTAQLGIPITVIFINNAIYGMTGGQMAPTTLIGQRTTTTPRAGRLLPASP